MRIRLNNGQLRIYTGSIAAYENTPKEEIVKTVKDHKNNKAYLRHASQHGLWVCISMTELKRYKLTPLEVAAYL